MSAAKPCGAPGEKTNPRRNRADNWIAPSLHGQVELREIRRAAEIPLPVAITDDHCRRTVQALLFRRKRAAAKRFDAEGFKEVAGDYGDIHTHRLTAAGNG